MSSNRKEGDMLDILEEMQWRLCEMLGSLHDENTITPAGDGVIGHLETKKIVRWYLDSFSAAVAAARVHLKKVEENEDKLYTEVDKAEIRTRIGARLEKEFDALTPVIEKYFYCRECHFIGLDIVNVRPRSNVVPIRNTANLDVKRQVVAESLEQLELLAQELDPLREQLRGCMG
jgi:hypothetical protein